MHPIVTCATAANNRPCTLRDLIITFNNFTTAFITIIYPTLLIVYGGYTVIMLLLNAGKPDAIATAKKRFMNIIIGSVFILGAWIIGSMIMKFLGWNGDVNNVLAWLPFIEVAEAATFPNPLNNSDVIAFTNSIMSIFTAIVAISLTFAYVYNGYNFITNSDNPEKLKESKRIFLIITVAGVLFFSLKAIGGALFETLRSLDTDQRQSANTSLRQPNYANTTSAANAVDNAAAANGTAQSAIASPNGANTGDSSAVAPAANSWFIDNPPKNTAGANVPTTVYVAPDTATRNTALPNNAICTSDLQCASNYCDPLNRKCDIAPGN